MLMENVSVADCVISMEKANYQEEMNVASALEEHRSGRDEDGQDQQTAINWGVGENQGL
jgi:hypothetical protein